MSFIHPSLLLSSLLSANARINQSTSSASASSSSSSDPGSVPMYPALSIENWAFGLEELKTAYQVLEQNFVKLRTYCVDQDKRMVILVQSVDDITTANDLGRFMYEIILYSGKEEDFQYWKIQVENHINIHGYEGLLTEEITGIKHRKSILTSKFNDPLEGCSDEEKSEINNNKKEWDGKRLKAIQVYNFVLRSLRADGTEASIMRRYPIDNIQAAWAAVMDMHHRSKNPESVHEQMEKYMAIRQEANEPASVFGERCLNQVAIVQSVGGNIHPIEQNIQLLASMQQGYLEVAHATDVEAGLPLEDLIGRMTMSEQTAERESKRPESPAKQSEVVLLVNKASKASKRRNRRKTFSKKNSTSLKKKPEMANSNYVYTVDSASSVNTSIDRSVLAFTRPAPKVIITTANGERLTGMIVGCMGIITKSGKNIRINKVYYHPRLEHNVISPSALEDQFDTETSTRDGVTTIKDKKGEVIMEGKRIGNSYFVDITVTAVFSPPPSDDDDESESIENICMIQTTGGTNRPNLSITSSGEEAKAAEATGGAASSSSSSSGASMQDVGEVDQETGNSRKRGGSDIDEVSSDDSADWSEAETPDQFAIRDAREMKKEKDKFDEDHTWVRETGAPGSVDVLDAVDTLARSHQLAGHWIGGWDYDEATTERGRQGEISPCHAHEEMNEWADRLTKYEQLSPGAAKEKKEQLIDEARSIHDTDDQENRSTKDIMERKKNYDAIFARYMQAVENINEEIGDGSEEKKKEIEAEAIRSKLRFQSIKSARYVGHWSVQATVFAADGTASRVAPSLFARPCGSVPHGHYQVDGESKICTAKEHTMFTSGSKPTLRMVNEQCKRLTSGGIPSTMRPQDEYCSVHSGRIYGIEPILLEGNEIAIVATRNIISSDEFLAEQLADRAALRWTNFQKIKVREKAVNYKKKVNQCKSRQGRRKMMAKAAMHGAGVRTTDGTKTAVGPPSEVEKDKVFRSNFDNTEHVIMYVTGDSFGRRLATGMVIARNESGVPIDENDHELIQADKEATKAYNKRISANKVEYKAGSNGAGWDDEDLPLSRRYHHLVGTMDVDDNVGEEHDSITEFGTKGKYEVYIDAARETSSVGRHIAHSNNPNCKLVHVISQMNEPSIRIVALSNIKNREAITADLTIPDKRLADPKFYRNDKLTPYQPCGIASEIKHFKGWKEGLYESTSKTIKSDDPHEVINQQLKKSRSAKKSAESGSTKSTAASSSSTSAAAASSGSNKKKTPSKFDSQALSTSSMKTRRRGPADDVIDLSDTESIARSVRGSRSSSITSNRRGDEKHTLLDKKAWEDKERSMTSIEKMTMTRNMNMVETITNAPAQKGVPDSRANYQFDLFEDIVRAENDPDLTSSETVAAISGIVDEVVKMLKEVGAAKKKREEHNEQQLELQQEADRAAAQELQSQLNAQSQQHQQQQQQQQQEQQQQHQQQQQQQEQQQQHQQQQQQQQEQQQQHQQQAAQSHAPMDTSSTNAASALSDSQLKYQTWLMTPDEWEKRERQRIKRRQAHSRKQKEDGDECGTKTLVDNLQASEEARVEYMNFRLDSKQWEIDEENVEISRLVRQMQTLQQQHQQHQAAQLQQHDDNSAADSGSQTNANNGESGTETSTGVDEPAGVPTFVIRSSSHRLSPHKLRKWTRYMMIEHKLKSREMATPARVNQLLLEVGAESYEQQRARIEYDEDSSEYDTEDERALDELIDSNITQ